MRIGEPARKHGVSDADIWHAVRTATRKIDLDDDLTMLIGPARDGTRWSSESSTLAARTR